MTQFIIFAFYLCISAMILIVAPVMMHPTLPIRRKLLICTLAFVVLVPGGLVLYGIFGAPQMAVSR